MLYRAFLDAPITEVYFNFKDLINKSGLSVMFIADYGFFSNEDIKWNNFTFTWLENIQPIIQNTETRMMREKENCINFLKEKKNKLTSSLNDCFSRVKELKQRDKISEGDLVLKDLAQISSEIEQFKKEVNK